MLRILCEDSAKDARITINGVFRGECPIDVSVAAGNVVVRANKLLDGGLREQSFEQTLSMGDGVIKKLEVVLGAPRQTAEGYHQEQLLKQAQAEAALKARQEAERKDAERKSALLQRLEQLKQQGVDVGNGKPFKDCAECPSMLLLPAVQPGAAPLAVGQFEITRKHYAHFVRETNRQTSPGCTVWERHNMFRGEWQQNLARNWQSPGFEQTDEHPVVCVSWADARDFAAWLSARTGKVYRIPNLQDYLTVGFYRRNARGQIERPPLPWTGSDTCRYSNVLDTSGQAANARGLGDEWACNDQYSFTSPVGSFPANPSGLFDLTGNVAEWLDWTRGDMTSLGDQWAKLEPKDVYGESWAMAARNSYTFDYGWSKTTNLPAGHQANHTVGFRVVREL